MKVLDFHMKKIMFLSLLGLTFVLGACSQTTAPTSVPNTNVGNPGNGATQSTSPTGYATFTYENVDVSIASVDQQNKFNDDNNASAVYILRLVTKESSKTDASVYVPYSDAFHLI